MRILTTTRPKRQSLSTSIEVCPNATFAFVARSIGFDLFSCTPWTQSFGGLDCSAVCGPRGLLAATFAEHVDVDSTVPDMFLNHLFSF